MQTVWIAKLEYNVGGEGYFDTSIVGVFSTKEKAKNFVSNSYSQHEMQWESDNELHYTMGFYSAIWINKEIVDENDQ